MNTKVFAGKWQIALLTLAAALALPGVASAQQHGGGGFHGGMGGGFHGGPGGGGFHGSPGGRFGGGYHGGGYGGGFRGGPQFGYGPHPFYGRGFYGSRGFYGGFALGAFVSTLPLYYNTYYWGGIPYYYYDDTYFRWNDGVSQYEVVAPPSGAPESATAPPSSDLFVYPKSGQSADQQKTDRYECHSWAATQSGFDPTAGAAADGTKRGDYLRAETACLTGRGYSVQ